VPDPEPANNLDGASVEVSARADLAIVKTASAPTALVGDTVTYGITVTNSGPDDAADVTVTDPLPAGGGFVSATPSAGTCATTAGSLVCNLGSLANGAAVTIQLRVTLTDAGDTHNVAQVTTSTPDPKPSNNQSATSSTTEQADVALTKTTSTPRPSIGQTISYTITARNAGPALARGVVITDPIPASLKYVSAKPSSGSCTVTQEALVCNVGDIASGRSTTVTLRAIVRRVGDAGNAASAVSRYPDDPNTANNLARTVVKAPPARLALRKTASRSSLSTGGHVTFRLRVRNTGDSPAHGVLVCDRMPSGLVAVHTSPKARLRDGAYCWTFSSLAPGRSKILTIVVSALSRASGRRINRATVNARDARPATASRAVTVHRIHVLGGGVTG
jgi:large repetitive protein